MAAGEWTNQPQMQGRDQSALCSVESPDIARYLTNPPVREKRLRKGAVSGSPDVGYPCLWAAGLFGLSSAQAHEMGREQLLGPCSLLGAARFIPHTISLWNSLPQESTGARRKLGFRAGSAAELFSAENSH